MTLPQLGSGLFLTDGGIETSLIFRPHPQVGETCGPAGGAVKRSSWLSITRPPGCSASKFRRCCSPAPTRWSN